MKKEHKTLRLKSVPESIHQLEVLIEEVCDANNLNQTYLGCISVAATEAFQNALTHGNRNDPEKIISVYYEKTATGVTFTISDEGEGFNHQTLPDLKDDGKEKTFPGRGLFLIKSLSDSLSFNEKGNEIAIGFKTAGIDIETSIDRAQKFKVYKESSQKIAK
jgi:serine/threonine-protein kinase RsbW